MEKGASYYRQGPETENVADAQAGAFDLSREMLGVDRLKAGLGVLAKPVKELLAQLEVIQDGNEAVLTLAEVKELAQFGFVELRKESTFQLSAEERRQLDTLRKRLPGLEARNNSLKAELVESSRELSGFFSLVGLFLRGELGAVKRLRNTTMLEAESLGPALKEARDLRQEMLARQDALRKEREGYGFIEDTGVRLTESGKTLLRVLAANQEHSADLPVSVFIASIGAIRELTENPCAISTTSIW